MFCEHHVLGGSERVLTWGYFEIFVLRYDTWHGGRSRDPHSVIDQTLYLCLIMGAAVQIFTVQSSWPAQSAFDPDQQAMVQMVGAENRNDLWPAPPRSRGVVCPPPPTHPPTPTHGTTQVCLSQVSSHQYEMNVSIGEKYFNQTRSQIPPITYMLPHILGFTYASWTGDTTRQRI